MVTMRRFSVSLVRNRISPFFGSKPVPHPFRYFTSPSFSTASITQEESVTNSPGATDSPGSSLSFGFSGAGFLGCYHVGAAACLHRHGLLPDPDNHNDAARQKSPPLITGVSAGSMIAAAILAGVKPEPDGMDVVLEATRRTRNLVRAAEQKEGEMDSKPSKGVDFGLSLDVLTPGFSLIDQVEGPFREALVKALGGTLPKKIESHSNTTEHTNDQSALYDIDPDLFARRFPAGSLRIGLTDRRLLWPPSISFSSQIREQKLLDAYRYVDSFRNVEDLVACCMLSSYIPGVTGPIPSNIKTNVPEFLSGILKRISNQGDDVSENLELNDASDRAGRRLREMRSFGLVKHGPTGRVIMEESSKDENGNTMKDGTLSTEYWDGGIVDMFPTFNENTVIITPVSGLFDPYPAICPPLPSTETELNATDSMVAKENSNNQQHKESNEIPSSFQKWQLQNILRLYLPTTFRHCGKSQIGINSKNAQTALKMMFSSEDEELYLRFREGYDDTRRFLNERGLLRVFAG